MKTTTLVAILLIALGLAAFAFYGISYTTREKVVDLGPIQVTSEKTRTLPLGPIVGIVGLVAGTVMLLASKKGTI